VTIIYSIKPFAGDFSITSPFGDRIDPITKLKTFHKGIDFGCPEGTPIRAVLDGKIISAGWECESEPKQGYGQRIWQECHFNDLSILVVYAHLSDIQKCVGEFISQAGIIGLSGSTGKSTGPHLHLGCRIKDTNTFLNFSFEDTPENEITIDGVVEGPWRFDKDKRL